MKNEIMFITTTKNPSEFKKLRKIQCDSNTEQRKEGCGMKSKR